jgi:5-methylcytosine-specific restriction endonuclease McrA
MSQVFVLDSEKRPLAPIHPGFARWLLNKRKAAVVKRFPFTLILQASEQAPQAPPEPLRLKIDPGSQTTGLALVHEASGQVVWAAELAHRGQHIKQRLDERRAVRRGRRQRKTRYRAPRFANRRGRAGRLPPSLESRVRNILTWVARLRRRCPIEAVSLELVCFDTQLMQDAEIKGIEYQQGTLAGYELREYLLEKWQRQCAYCGKTGVPLEIEHLTPKARGGSDRASNLTLACQPCNQAKGTRTTAEFGYPHLQAQAKAPLKDAAAVNATRWALYECLTALGLPMEVGTGGRTKWNRTKRGLPKTHWLDAVCVGASTPGIVHIEEVTPLLITATGRQSRQMCLMNRYGFPRTRAKGQRVVKGFQTGDMVRAVVPTGKRVGTYRGKVAIKANGQFTITTTTGTVPDISHRYCRLLQRADGYSYRKGGHDCLSLP